MCFDTPQAETLAVVWDAIPTSPGRALRNFFTTSIYRGTWPVSAPAPQMIGNGSRTIQKPKHSDSQQATSARLRYGDKERSGVEQREGKMGPPLSMAHAEVPCPRGQAPIWPQIAGPLPLRSSSSTHPHTHTHTQAISLTPDPLWVKSQKHRISVVEKAQVLSGTLSHPLKTHVSLRTFWTSDLPSCQDRH